MQPNIRRIWIGVGGLVLLAAGGGYLWWSRQGVPALAPTSTQSESELTFRPGSFEMDIAPSWRRASEDEVDWPRDITGSQFALAHKDLPCVLGYAWTNAPLFGSYRQVSFAERIFTVDGAQLDGDWRIHEEKVPAGFSFRAEERYPLPGEVRVHTYPPFLGAQDKDLRGIFALFATNGGVVPEQCVSESVDMLKSLRRKFEAVGTASPLHGIAYLKYDYHPTPPRLFFLGDGDPVEKVIMEFKDGVQDPKVADGVFYFSTEKGVRKLNLDTKQAETMFDLAAGEARNLISYYPFAGRFYYTVSERLDCISNNCEAALYEYDPQSQKHRLIKDGLAQRAIIAHEAGGQKLYLMSGYGDAGCFWASIATYDLASSLTGPERKFSGCEGDPDNDEEGAPAYQRFLKGLEQSVVRRYALRLEGGRIQMPNETTLTGEGWGGIEFIR